ncbi:hypothetical protein [Enterococcus gallinarum]|uniref:hypothetical protein n=1 Tax=Enterococcus gallinarum TaxID=1353 RepID=UPI0018AAF8FB|nr:hypothetical protein [Enterococcus gallinarum]
MKKWNELSKATKRISIVIGAAVVLGGGFGGYKVYAQQQHTQAKAAIEASLEEVGNQGALAKTIATFANEKGYLAKDLDSKAIDTVKQQLNTLRNSVADYEEKYSNEDLSNEAEISKLEKEISTVESKLSTQLAVNKLYQQETQALNGSEVAKSLVLADKVDAKAVEAVKLDKFSEDEWKKSVQGLLDQATTQVKDIESATKAVNDCYKDNKVKSDVTKKSYESAKKAVDKVKRQTDKEALQNKLTEIKKVVDANEKKAKEAEEKKKAEAEASENGGTVVETKEGEYEVVSESNGEGNTGSQSQSQVGNNSSGGPSRNSGSGSYSSGNSSSYKGGGSSSNSGNSGGSSIGGVSGSSGSNSGSGSNSNAGNSGSGGGSNSSSGTNSGSNSGNTGGAPTIVSGYVGNSGKVFGSAVEANNWANGQIDSGTAGDNGYSGYYLVGIFYSDGSEKFSIDWY